MSKRVLVIFAHLYFQYSVLHKAMASEIRGMDCVLWHDLAETYPDFFIDVAEEQALLNEADLLVFQFPVYWYSSPAILKHWQDMVLTMGYAYGQGGDKLKGKDFMLAITTGGDEDSYQPGRAHGKALEDFYAPFQQTTAFCGMSWLEPLVLQGGHQLSDDDINRHAVAYREFFARYAAGEN